MDYTQQYNTGDRVNTPFGIGMVTDIEQNQTSSGVLYRYGVTIDSPDDKVWSFFKYGKIPYFWAKELSKIGD